MVQRIDVTLGGLHELRGRIEREQLEAGDWPVFGALVSQLITRTQARQQRMLAKTAAARADDHPMVVGGEGSVVDAEHPARAELGDSSVVAPDSGVKSTGDDAAAAAGGRQGVLSAETADSADAPEPKEKKGKGHGRNGARAYDKAKHLFHTLTLGVIGMLCGACGIGRMSRYREKVVVRVLGQPLFCAEAHHYEQTRCKNCGHIIRAAGPASVLEGVGSSYVTYDWSACAMLIVMHYFGGAPFKRLESLHQGWGIPMADANQWTMVDACDDLLLPLYRALEQHAIQNATNFRIDDTGSVVIALRRKIHAEIAALSLAGESTKNVRTGINATGLYWETPNGPVILFYTGRHHAGEIVDQLFRHRQGGRPKLVKVTDGASKNFDHEHHDKMVEATCNAHAFLKFRAIKDKHPDEYAVAGRIYKQVFDHDDQAKARGLTPMDRMLYHREHSEPLMKELKAMCEHKLLSKLVEPNSPLWEPLTFVVNQWDRLMRFCQVPDVPLDSNRVEQALIIPVRYLAGSFNYQSEDGAAVGDHCMSLIATARANGVEPVAYLTECLRSHQDLAHRPEHYLPWIYRERLKQADSPPTPTREHAAVEALASP